MHQVTVAVIEMAIFWKRYGPEEIVQVGIYGNKTNNKQYVSKSFATPDLPPRIVSFSWKAQWMERVF